MRLLIVASLACAALAAGCGSSGSVRVGQKHTGPTRVLTMLSPIGDTEELDYFARQVEQLSHGDVRVRIVPAGHTTSPDFETATIRDVQHGRGDLAFAGARAWDQFGRFSLRALTAPLLIDSYPLQQRVLESDLADKMLAELRPLGLVGIGIQPGGMRRPAGVSRRLGGPADYRGLRIGTQESRIADETMRAFGARPIRLGAGIRGSQGVDGFEQRVYTLQGNRMIGRGSHITANVDLWPRPLVIFAGARAWKRLTAAQHEVLLRAARNAVPGAAPTARGSEVETTGDLCRSGVTFDLATPSDLAALRRAVAPVYRDLERDPATRAAIQQIERLKAQLGEPAARVPACTRRTGSPAPAATTVLEGVWRMDTQRRAAKPDFLDENWGHWIFVFDHGKFADTQENKDSCTWGYGTFAVRGSQTSWKFTDGGGIAPNGAENKPGEFFVFGLSAFRDTLKLSQVHGQISPLNFRAKPWRHISATPSRRFFSTRCPPPADALPRR